MCYSLRVQCIIKINSYHITGLKKCKWLPTILDGTYNVVADELLEEFLNNYHLLKILRKC